MINGTNTYQELGLTDRLRAINSLPERDPGWQDSLAFDALVERASIKAVQLSQGAAGTSAIADLSVTTAKLAGSAVTNVKLASSSVDSRVIGNEAVGSVEIGSAVIHGTHIADYNYALGTGNLSAGGGTFNSGVLGTSVITGGSLNSSTVGTPTIIRPTIDGTANFDVSSGSAALGASGDFAIQTHSGSAVLAVRSGGTTYLFFSGGTI